MPRAAASEVIERIRRAADPRTVARVALEASLAASGAQRGLVALVDLGSGALYPAHAVGLASPNGALTSRFDPTHPLYAVVRDGSPASFRAQALARPPLSRLRRLGLTSVTALPLAADTVVSPCLAAGRCLSAQCLVRERTASASPDEEWIRRVGTACVRAFTLRSCGIVLLDTPGLPDGAVRAALDEIAQTAGRSLRRLAEAAPRGDLEVRAAEEEWARRAFGAVDDPIVVVSAEGQMRYANPRAHSLFTARATDSEGRRRAVDFNRLMLEAWLESSLRLRDAERAREFSLVDPEEGSELLFELLTSTAHNPVTRETGTVLVMKDVSDIRRAVEEVEATLRRAEDERRAAQGERDQLDLILEGIDQPIVVAEASGPASEGVLAGGVGEIVRMNAAAKRLLEPARGAREEERASVRRNDAVLTTLLSQAGIAGETSREVALTDPKTGEPRAYAAMVAVARAARGMPAPVICVLADVTGLRELERRRVEHQLFESEKLAATGRLAASFAHEINNPLEAMKNALYLLREQNPPGDPRQRYLDIMRQETDRISGIVRMILGFYRPSIKRTTTDLNALLRDVGELMRQQLRKARVRCELILDPLLPTIVASPDQLRQVFLNLLLNAMQAMPSGGEVRVITALAPAESSTEPRLVGGGVTVEVQDTGGGIPPEVQSHLFEPFFSTKTQGTGLGLWVCREIVQAHGGSIRLTSRPGAGTTVTTSLPLVAPEQTDAR